MFIAFVSDSTLFIMSFCPNTSENSFGRYFSVQIELSWSISLSILFPLKWILKISCFLYPYSKYSLLVNKSCCAILEMILNKNFFFLKIILIHIYLEHHKSRKLLPHFFH